MVFDVMAVYATDYFYQSYKGIHNAEHRKDKTKTRPFLFSDNCVSYEIKEHALGYWYSIGWISKLTFVTTAMYAYKGFNKDKVKASCEKIDIAEQDATKARDRTMFGYFTGIRDCYKYTAADPYAHLVLINNEMVYANRIYQNVRNTWKKNKIATYML